MAFWLVGTAGAGALLAGALAVLEIRQPLAWGVLTAALVAIPGLARPALVRRPYEAWNRLTRAVRRAARLWLTGAAFLVVLVVSRGGTRLAWTAPREGESGWMPKRQLEAGSHRFTTDFSNAAAGDSGFRSLAGWARRSGNVWAWSLVPLLSLLRIVEGRSAGSLGGNVYTLY